jgi:hypothetical protein
MMSDIRNEIQPMLEMNVIEETNSPYASPIVMIKKRDGSYRFCVDYRKLNQITVFDPEPMVRHDELFTQVRDDQNWTCQRAIGKSECILKINLKLHL